MQLFLNSEKSWFEDAISQGYNHALQPPFLELQSGTGIDLTGIMKLHKMVYKFEVCGGEGNS